MAASRRSPAAISRKARASSCRAAARIRTSSAARVSAAWLPHSLMAALIQLNDLAKIYQSGDTEFAALHDVNLTIERGEFVAITGSSGSGKSTLMNILGCLDSPTRGSYLLGGPGRGAAVARRAGARAQRADRLRVPEFQPAGAHLGGRERRAAADLRAGAAGRAARACARSAGARGPRAIAPGIILRSSPVASSSAWPSRARW